MATVSNDVGFCKDSRLLSISVGEIEKKKSICLKKKKHNENHQVKMPPSFKFKKKKKDILQYFYLEGGGTGQGKLGLLV